MGKIPPARLQEILFGSSDKTESRRIGLLEQEGLITKIAPRIYTSRLNEEPSLVVRRNWYHILANQYPNALISHRSALEFRPTANGHIYLTYSYNNTVSLPGLIIHFLLGPGKIEGDRQLFENLFVSQEARAFLENMQQTRKEGEESKILSQIEIEEKLETIIRVKGEDAFNVMRDRAKEIAPILRMEKEFARLNKIMSNILGIGISKNLHSDIAKWRVLGEPIDPGRIILFEKLYNHLTKITFPDYFDQNKSIKSYQNFAFFEGYFSNYIEGTEFTIEEAKEIIANETPLPARDEDSHDILGTYRIVSDKNEMIIIPRTADEFLKLMQDRHAILLSARLSKKPGEFKDRNNRAGSTEFVDWQLVRGTLKKGFEWYLLLQHPFAKAAYMMFLISEVHPFLDGNGRIARVMMNAELSSKGMSKIIIPTVYRDDYLGALKKLTKQVEPDAYARMLLKAYQFSSNVFDENRDLMEKFLLNCNAFKEPKEGKLKIIYAILVNNEWSSPRPVEYGKNIRLHPAQGGFSVRVYNASGISIEQFVDNLEGDHVIYANEMAAINPQMISFKIKDGEERIEYELF